MGEGLSKGASRSSRGGRRKVVASGRSTNFNYRWLANILPQQGLSRIDKNLQFFVIKD
jgi:hypothetical protein